MLEQSEIRESERTGESQSGLLPLEIARESRFIFPLEEPLLRYYDTTLRVAHGRSERLRFAFGAHSATSRERVLIDPHGVPRRIPEGAHAPGLAQAIEMISDVVGSDVGRLLADGDPKPIRWILLLDYPGTSRHRMILFVFPAGAALPETVIKLRPASADGPALSREQAALEHLRAVLPADLKRTVPAAIRFIDGDPEMLVLKHLPGISAYVEMRNRLLPWRRIPVHLSAAARWIARFQQATKSGATFDPMPWAERVGIDASELAPHRRELALPLSAAHGDFWPRNLLVGSPSRVVDWEHFRELAPPFEDLFHFAVSCALETPDRLYRRVDPEVAFADFFVRGGKHRAPMQRYFATYCSATGISRAVLGTLLRGFLLDRDRKPPEPDQPERRIPWGRLATMMEEPARSIFSGE